MTEFTEWRSLVDGERISAIPDTSMFQNAVYQWWGESIDASDSTSPVDWPESLAGLSDASAVGSPTKTTQSGFEAVEYDPTDGDEDYHTFNPDNQFPTGDSAFAIFALAYLPSSLDDDAIFAYGDNSITGGAISFRIDSGNVDILRSQDGGYSGGSPETGQWVTLGTAYDGNGSQDIGFGGTFGTNISVTWDLRDQNHAIGYYLPSGIQALNATLAEVIYCNGDETDQAFSDYHNDRLG